MKPYKPKGAREKNEKSSNAFVFLGANETADSSWLVANILAETNVESFLTLPPGHAIIDPGASQDLIGIKSYRRLQKRLAEEGLQAVQLSEMPSPASGIGGDAKPLFCSLVPCILGGKPGVIQLTIVSQDVPQLLSVGLLEHSGAIIDVANNRIRFSKLDSSADLTRLSSGHRTLDVASWKGSSFEVPRQLLEQFGLKEDAFNLPDSSASRVYAAAAESSCQVVRASLLMSMVGDKAMEETPLGRLARSQVNWDRECLQLSAVQSSELDHTYRASWIFSHKDGYYSMYVLETAHDMSLLESRQISIKDLSGNRFKPGDQLFQLFSLTPIVLRVDSLGTHACSPAASSTKLDSATLECS